MSAIYWNERSGNRSFDGVRRSTTVTETHTFYALIRPNSGAGIRGQYLLDVQVVSHGSLNFPDLVATVVTWPGQGPRAAIRFGILDGQEHRPCGHTRSATGVTASIFPRMTTLSSDDLFSAVFAHVGVLAVGASYQQTQTFQIPDGTHGDYFTIVKVDATNSVNEFVLEGNNITFSATTTKIDLPPYVDLKPERLTISGPNPDGTYTFGWTTANRGDLAANGGWKEHIVVTNLTTGATSVDRRGRDRRCGGKCDSVALPVLCDRTGGPVPGHHHDGFSRPLFRKQLLRPRRCRENNTVQTSYDATLDLQVTNLQISPPSGLQSGADILITWSDSNTGNRPVGISFVDRVEIKNLTTGETLASTTVPYDATASGLGPIVPGEPRARQFNFTLPDGGRGVGQIQFSVTTDDNHAVVEYITAGDAETNNSTSLTQSSVLGEVPDLQVVNVSFDPASGIQSGTNVTVRWDDSNVGNKSTSSSWFDSVVVKNTTTGEILATGRVGYDASLLGPISPDSTRARQFVFAMPDGPKSVGAIAVTITGDIDNQLFESNPLGTGESNNIASGSFDSTIALIRTSR